MISSVTRLPPPVAAVDMAHVVSAVPMPKQLNTSRSYCIVHRHDEPAGDIRELLREPHRASSDWVLSKYFKGLFTRRNTGGKTTVPW
jgi:hypothetical protein